MSYGPYDPTGGDPYPPETYIIHCTWCEKPIAEISSDDEPPPDYNFCSTDCCNAELQALASDPTWDRERTLQEPTDR